jgi:zinc protease
MRLAHGGILLLALLALLTLPALAAENPAAVLDLSHIQDQTLDNGLRVIIKSEPYWKAVALGAVLRTGSKDDPEGKSGLAHLVEHLLFEPTLPAKSLSLEVENLGGFVQAATTADFTQITVAVASQFAPDLMPHLAEALFGAKFTDEQVEAEKTIVLREIQDADAQVLPRLGNMIWDLSFTAHPYRFPVTGTADSVAKLTADDARKFYRQHYVAGNVALIAVGDLDPTSFFALARQHFGGYPKQSRPAENLPAEPEQTEARTRIVNLGVSNIIFRYAWHAPGISDKTGVCAMDLLYTALQGGETSLLSKALDQQGLALDSSCSFLTQKYPGLFTITVVTPPDKELAARKALLGVVATLRDKQFSDQELRYLKRLLYADYAFSNQSYPDQVGSLAFYEAIDTYRFATSYLNYTNAVSAEQIQATARKYLREDNYDLVILRPQAEGPQGEAV